MTNVITSHLKTKLEIFSAKIILQNRRCYLKLIFFQKIVNTIIPAYLTNCLNTNYNLVYNTRASEQSNIRRFRTRTEHFKQPFSLSVSMDGTN